MFVISMPGLHKEACTIHVIGDDEKSLCSLLSETYVTFNYYAKKLTDRLKNIKTGGVYMYDCATNS
jgi:hypothetical protein